MAVKVYRDGRTKLTGKDYSAHKMQVWLAQDRYCADCGIRFPWKAMHFHHDTGRGTGGSKRDDLSKKNVMLCPTCHQNRHVHIVDGARSRFNASEGPEALSFEIDPTERPTGRQATLKGGLR